MKIFVAFSLFLAAQPTSALVGRFFKPPTETVGKAKSKSVTPTIPVKTTGLPPMNTDNKGLQNIFYQNQAWKAEKLAEDKDFFSKLGSTHTPEFMYIGKHLLVSTGTCL